VHAFFQQPSDDVLVTKISVIKLPERRQTMWTKSTKPEIHKEIKNKKIGVLVLTVPL